MYCEEVKYTANITLNVDGTITLVIPDTDTFPLPEYGYDMVLTKPGGDKVIPYFGRIFIGY